MRRSGSARAPPMASSSSSSSDCSLSPPRRPKKRARSAEPNTASPARGGDLWRESRAANGQVVLSLESDDDEEDGGGGETQAMRLQPTKRSVAAPAVVTPRAKETAAKATTAPVVYCVDSDEEGDEDENDDDDDDVEIVERVSPSEEVGTTVAGESEQEQVNAKNGEEEDEDEDDDEASEEEEEEGEPAMEDTEETHGSEEHDGDDDDDENSSDDEDNESGDGERDEAAVVSTTVVRPCRSATTSDSTERLESIGADAAPVKQEVLTPVKAEPSVTQPLRILTPSPIASASSPAVAEPTTTTPMPMANEPAEPVAITGETEPEPLHADEPDGPLVSFSQIEHESPPVRMRPAHLHPHRHPRAARRATVRRRRLDPDHAGMLLFDGPQYAPSAGVVKNLIEFIARTVGPLTGHERHWIDYVLLAKLNDSVAALSTEVFSRHSEWMKITLGASDETRLDKHHVQREPLMVLPIRYTVRPSNVVMPKTPSASNGKVKAKNPTTTSAARQKQKQRTVDSKWLEKRANEVQSGEKRVKSETSRRRASAGVPPQANGPFSPTSSITSSASSRAQRAHRGVGADSATHDFKRQRVAEASPLSNGMPSPSTTAASSPWPSADIVDLANDDPTTGKNRSMPNNWDPVAARTTPSSMRPAAMNPLFTMPLSELKAHINSVRRDGRARSFEKPLEILQKLMHHPRNRETFNSPVDPVALNLPTYLDVIKEPMDLGTIKIRLEEAAYVEQDDFITDVRLVFENAMRFNAPNHSVHVDASVLLNLFENLLNGGKRDRPLKRRAPTANSDRHACRGCLGRSCVMCDQGCLEFAQPHLVCTGSCGVDLRKGSIYFSTRDGTRVWCGKCRTRHVRTASDMANNHGAKNGGEILVDEDDHAQGAAKTVSKKKKKTPRRVSATKESDTGIDTVYIPGELIKKKCELDVEPWVKCSRCLRWLHQVCGLYNSVYGAYTPEHEYQCPLCVWKLRAPTPPLSTSSLGRTISLLNDTGASELPEQQYESSCHQIPTCELSTFIEAFLRRGLQDMGEAQAATDLHVRVLAFPHERVVVSERLTKAFDDNAIVLQHVSPDAKQRPLRFPCEIPYTSRGIYLFQRHDGVDVALFTLFVQEFGDDCPLPANRRSVYVAYLDSIRYLTPPSARTAAYHLIMMAYFDFIRRHGFERVHIWSCPPQKRISYVFWCRPSFQKTPSAEHLRAWYRRLLTKSKDAGIVQSWTTTYDQYFSKAAVVAASTAKAATDTPGTEGNSSVATRGTAARSIDPMDHLWPTSQLPPLFDGDFLPAEFDRILGRLAARNGKYRRGSLVGMNGGKSSSLGSMGGKLAVGEFVARIKEENRASAAAAPAVPHVEFKVREIFDRLQHAVQRLKNDLLVVDLVVLNESAAALPERSLPLALPTHVPAWWHHVPRLFGSRFMFHQLCASATYQFDTLRRAKHSTMMLLHHFKNESVRQLNVFCSECFLLITHADFWHCPTCVRFALCDLCHHRDGRSHAHRLTFGGGFVLATATSKETSAETVAEAVEEADAATTLTTLGGRAAGDQS